MNQAKQPNPQKGPSGDSQIFRMVDFKIPLWSLLTAAFIGIGAIVSMYYKLETVGATLNEVQANVRAYNSSGASTANAIALLEYRLNLVERRLQLADVPGPGR